MTKTVTIVSPHGLHLRPVRHFVELANRFQSEVTVSDGKQRVNGRSAINLLTLGVKCGASLTLDVQGPDAEQALDALAEAIVQVFPEDVD
jgi:phosphotransferase system HPr (HPr) family protein